MIEAKVSGMSIEGNREDRIKISLDLAHPPIPEHLLDLNYVDVMVFIDDTCFQLYGFQQLAVGHAKESSKYFASIVAEVSDLEHINSKAKVSRKIL